MTALPTLKLRVLPTFPSSVVGDGPITVTKTAGIYTISFSVTPFGSVAPPPANYPTDFLLGYDSLAGTFFKIPLSIILSNSAAQTGASYTYVDADRAFVKKRSNSSSPMVDTLPGTSLGVMGSGWWTRIVNTDAAAILAIGVAAGATLDGLASGSYVYLGPSQAATVYSDGANYITLEKPARCRLAAATTIYAGGTGSSASNAGLSSGTGAFNLIQTAITFVGQRLDLAGNNCTIQIADGNYTENLSLVPYIGRGPQGHTGPVMIQGNSGSTTAVSLQPATGDVIAATETGGFEWAFQNLKIAPAAGSVNVDAFGWVVFGPGITFGTTTQNQVVIQNGGKAEFTANYAIAGGGASHILYHSGGQVIYTGGQTVTITNTPTFASGFIFGARGGIAIVPTVTYSGAVAAVTPRWSRDTTSVLFTAGADPNSVFPGTVNGSVTPLPVSEGGTGGITVAQAQAALFICFPPQGRLTLSTGVPVMTSTVSGATTVYYTPDQGRFVPIYNGTSFVMTDTGGEISQLTTDATKSPAAVAASKIYDIFVWNDSGTIRATRGPAWSSSSTRGTGAGTSELQLLNGWLTNKIAITNGPGANLGTYVGSIASNGSSTIDFIYAAAVTAASFNVWNMYNRRTIGTTVTDTAASYTYTSATIRQKRGSATNQVGFLLGQPEEVVQGIIKIRVDTVAALNANVQVGFGFDTITGLSGRSTLVLDNVAAAGRTEVVGLPTQWSPGIGTHILSSNEQGDSANANTLNTGSTDELNAVIRM